MSDESRLRGLLEIATAILLGLVSVATAAGAYQASEWGAQAARYESIAGQLRDTSLSLNLASQIALADDARRSAEALALQFRIMNGTEDADALRAEQLVVLAGGSPGLSDEWTRWLGAGMPTGLGEQPMTGAEFVAGQLSPSFGANRASADAFALAEQLGERSLILTVASAVFALALLLLGVSGANRSLRVSFGLALGGAGAFVVGVAVSVLAVVG